MAKKKEKRFAVPLLCVMEKTKFPSGFQTLSGKRDTLFVCWSCCYFDAGLLLRPIEIMNNNLLLSPYLQSAHAHIVPFSNICLKIRFV